MLSRTIADERVVAWGDDEDDEDDFEDEDDDFDCCVGGFARWLVSDIASGAAVVDATTGVDDDVNTAVEFPPPTAACIESEVVVALGVDEPDPVVCITPRVCGARNATERCVIGSIKGSSSR